MLRSPERPLPQAGHGSPKEPLADIERRQAGAGEDAKQALGEISQAELQQLPAGLSKVHAGLADALASAGGPETRRPCPHGEMTSDPRRGQRRKLLVGKREMAGGPGFSAS